MAQNSFTLIPHIVVNPTSIVQYNEIIFDKPRSSNRQKFFDIEAFKEDRSSFVNSTRKSGGNVSEQAKRKIGKAIEYLTTVAQPKKAHERLSGKTVSFRVNFLTLTLPSTQIHSDSEIINKCLNSFLTECRKIHNLKNYVWRAELQKNGNIHFHIISDVFIPWYDARNRWNRIVNKLGYVDRFHEKHGHRTPNSTDIHSTRKIHNLKAYLMKYMSKAPTVDLEASEQQPDERLQTGRIWGCNQELSKTRGLNLIIDSEIESELKKVITDNKVRKFEGSYFTVYYLDYHTFRKCGADILFQYFSDYLFEQLHYSEQLTFS